MKTGIYFEPFKDHDKHLYSIISEVLIRGAVVTSSPKGNCLSFMEGEINTEKAQIGESHNY